MEVQENKPIYERQELTAKEKKIVHAVTVEFMLLLVFLMSIKLGDFAGVPALSEISKQLDVPTHVSSPLATFMVFYMVFDTTAKIANRRKLSENELIEVQRWIPILATTLTALAHWIFESGMFGKSWGTPDVIDAIYGLAAIIPVYILLWNTLPARPAHTPSEQV